jgi:predicted nucleotidyltransferase
MFNQDYNDLLRLLSDHNVNYVIVGAYAMAAHGYVRATGDIDIFVEPTPENAVAVFASLLAFGAPLSWVMVEDFRTPGTVYQIGVPPNRIDILTDIDGLTFDEAGSFNVEIDGLTVPFLDLESLKRNKASTGRTKDKLDLELLKEFDESER